MNNKIKKNIRRNVKSILHTYMKDGDTNILKYWFKATRYILTYK